MNYLLGIDAGGTKTIVSLYKVDGHLLEQIIVGPANVYVDYENGMQTIKAALATIFQKYPAEKCSLILIGIAGLRASQRRQDIEDYLSQFAIPFDLVSDIELAYYAILDSVSEGVLTLAGTGSVTLLKTERAFSYFGGWGQILGDDGSAYHIGLEALKTLAKHEECSNVKDVMLETLSKHLKSHSVADIIKQVQMMNKRQIASLAQLVDSYADQSLLAQEILVEAGRALAKQTSRAIDFAAKSQDTEISLVGLTGSVLIHSQTVRETLKQDLLHTYPQLRFKLSDISDHTKAVVNLYQERTK